MTAAASAVPASAVILLRSAESAGFEVFFTRGSGGAYRFPGGTVSREDCEPRLLQRCCGLTPEEARRILGAQLKPALAIGHWVAAARYLFEQTGFLLAAGEDSGDWTPEGLSAKQASSIQGSFSFEAFLKDNRLICDLGRLLYFSRWQTGPDGGARHDKRFFVVALPGGQKPVARDEAAEALWRAPDRALQLFTHQQLPIGFATYTTVRTLADFETIESVMKEYGRKRLE